MNFMSRKRLLFAAMAVLAILGIMLVTGLAIFRPAQPRLTASSLSTPPPAATGPSSELLHRGEAAFEAGDYAAAIAAYNAALALNPNFAEAYNDRGLAHFRRDENDLAIADYEHALALRPDYANALTNHGIAIFDRGDYDAVIAEMSRAIELDPSNDRAFVFRGNAYQRKGDYAQAISDWLSARATAAQRQSPGY